jgi:SAM-dependent methyltransferase
VSQPVPGGWETWQWDATLFEGSAPYYMRGRPPYAPGLADAMREHLGLDGTGRLLDCGCGPGVIALQLAHLFEEVVGLDPDPGMIEEAERIAKERGVANARWVQLRAEELPAGLGMFRAMTFAASFHWMDRPKVASIVRTMLEPGGAAVQVDAPVYRPLEAAALEGARYPAVPHHEIEALRIRYLGPDRRAGQSIRNTSPGGEDAVFQATGFLPAVEVVVPDGREIFRSTDDVVALVVSSSATAPHLFGARLPDFEAELRATLRAASPEGMFSVRLSDNVLRIWRPAWEPAGRRGRV